MTTEVRGETPILSTTVKDGGDGTPNTTPVTTKGIIFSPRNPTYTDGDRKTHVWPERMIVHY